MDSERRPIRFSARPQPRYAAVNGLQAVDRKGGAVHAGGRNFRRKERSGAGIPAGRQAVPNGESAGSFGKWRVTVDYDAVKTCLSKQFAPAGLELEWQTQIHGASQRASETILEFAGRLRSLADKACPSWTAERRLEVARN